MLILKAGLAAIRLAWPHVLCPWRSPLLRWRLETYGIADGSGRMLRASEITAGVFWRFAWRRRREMGQFLLWAARMRDL